jgi:hypothetical protein
MIANRITVGGQDIEFTGASQIEISRGAEPSYASFFIADPAPFRGLSNPVTIEITTPKAEDVNQEVKLVLKNWHIIEISPHTTGLYRMVLADNRFIAKYPKLNKSYNVKTIDGVYRISSLKNGQSYLVTEALEAINVEHGLTLRIDSRCANTLSKLNFLPTNLGNSEGGGFFAEEYSAVIPPITERIRASITIDRDGNVMLTDRVTDCTVGLIDRGAYEGLIDQRDIHWQIPDNIKVLFQQRFERCFESIEDPQGTSSPLPDFEYEVQNVVPAPQDPSLLAGPSYFMRFDPEFLNSLGYTLAAWRERYFKSTMIPDSVMLTVTQLTAKRRRAELGKSNWHLLYRVNFNVNRNRIWTNLVMGRLGADGKTIKASYVFMDYTVLHEYPFFDRNGTQSVRPYQSTRYPFPDLTSLDLVDSPFVADFAISGRNELLFKIAPLDMGIRFASIVPCLTTEDATWLDRQAFVTDQEQGAVFDKLVASTKHRMRVYFHALLSDDNGPNGSPRYYEITKPNRKTGSQASSGRTLVVRSDSVTANWGMQSNRSTLLLNGVTLTQEADEIVARLSKAYADAKAGFLACVGVECLLNDANWVGGNINRIVIRIGMDADASFTITTLFEVLPEISEIIGDVRTDTGYIAQNGLAPELVG